SVTARATPTRSNAANSYSAMRRRPRAPSSFPGQHWPMSAQAPTDPLPLLRIALAGGPREPRRQLLEAGAHATPPAELAARRAAVPAATLDRCLDWLASPGHHFLAWNDPRYPPLLRQCPDAPLGLFVDGAPDHLWQPALAVVGSRSASAGGRDNAREFARAF